MTDITANVIVSMPSQLFTMARSFKAVANGKIYIGKIDTDPVNPENQIQVYVENEDGSHVPVSQPIIINAGGYPVYNGQIAKFVTVQGHSMAIYNAFGVQEFYYPNVLKYDPDGFRQELSSPNGSALVGFNSSTVYETLERLSNRTIIDAREFGLTTAGINTTAKLLAAISECNSIGAALGIGGTLDFGDAEVVVTDLCDIFGAGGFKNLRFVINQTASDTLKQINGVTISTQAQGGDHGFVLKKGRFIDFINIKAKDVESVIKGETNPASVFHGIGSITISNMNAINVGRMVDLRHDAADPYAYNDFKFTNNRGWFTRYGGFYAEQLDGLQFSDNLLHSERNTVTHTNHLYVKAGEWVNIGGANTYFEGGKEAVLLEDVGSVSIGGNNVIAFCGQQTPASGVKVNNAGSSKFLNLSVSDGCISVEKPTLHGLEIVAPSGSMHVATISANVDLRAGDAGTRRTYFGSTPLNSIAHFGVSVSGGCAAYGDTQSKGLLIDAAGISSRLLDSNTSTASRANIARMDNKSAAASATLTVNIASGVATTLIGPRSYQSNDPNTPCSGKLTVQAYNATGTKSAVYELLYKRNSGSSADVLEISHLHDASIVADTPAFTFQTSSSGALQVFPKQQSSGSGYPAGDFTFVISAIGNLTLASR